MQIVYTIFGLCDVVVLFCSPSLHLLSSLSLSPLVLLSLNPLQTLFLHNSMGSATSSIPAEPIVVVAAVAGLSYGYAHYFRPAHSSDEDAYSDTIVGASKATSTLRGQKKRGRKLQVPGDATLKNLDVLDAPVPGSLSVSTSTSKSRERQRQLPPPPQEQQQEAPAAHAQSRVVVPGGFDGTVTSVGHARDTPQEQSQPSREPQQVQARQQQQQHVSVAATKKPKKKKGKKTAAVAVSSDPSPASALGASPPSTEGVARDGAAPAADMRDERWTRVEARKKKVTVPPQDGLAELQTAETSAADITTSDAGVTTSVTGNSSPVTERTTEDELRSEPDECVFLFLLSSLVANI